MDRLNPAFKALAILLAGIILCFSPQWKLNAAVCAASAVGLAVSRGVKPRTVVMLILPAFLVAASFFFTGWRFSAVADTKVSTEFNAAVISPSFANGLSLGTRVLAFAMIGMVFALTTPRHDFAASMVQTAGVPPRVAYGVLAAVHLIPTIQREYRASKTAFRVRGIRLRPFDMRPIFCLTVRTLRWADSVSMAMESKGFSDHRTQWRDTPVRWIDWVFVVAVPAAVLCGVLFWR